MTPSPFLPPRLRASACDAVPAPACDVVIATTGRPSLVQAVHAALAQTADCRTVILVDGAHPNAPAAADLAARLAEADERVLAAIVPPDWPGREGDRLKHWWLNAGAPAPFVKFLDDDDWMPPHGVAALLEPMADPAVAVASGMMICLAAHGGRACRWRVVSGALEPGQVGMGSVLLRAAAARGVPFDVAPHCDFRWIERLCAAPGSFVRVLLPVYWYNGHRVWRCDAGEWRRVEL